MNADLEAALRRSLDTYEVETIASADPPPVAAIILRARSEPVRRHRLRRASLISAGTLAIVGGAAAAGVLPGPVESMLSEFRSWGYQSDGNAVEMASATAGDWTYAVWMTSLDDGGRCVFELVTGPAGELPHGGGGAHCVPELASQRAPDRFQELAHPETVFDNSTGADPVSTPRHSTGWGQAPLGATAVVFEFADGNTLRVETQRDGYFITTFPNIDNGTRITDVRAIDAGGHDVTLTQG